MRKICMLTNVHSPYDQRIFSKEARSLAAAGYDVTIIAPGTQADPVACAGVRIRSIPLPGGVLGRCLNLLRLVAMGWRERADAYHLHDPELLPVGLLLRLVGMKVIYDVHEHFPQVAHIRSWIPRALRRPVAGLVDVVERLIARQLSAVIGVVDEQQRRFGHRPFAAVKNFPRLEYFPRSRSQNVRGKEFDEGCQLTHIGSLSAERGAIFLLEVMNCLTATHPGVRLLCLGTFHTEHVRAGFDQKLREYRLADRVIVQTRRVDYERLGEIITASQVGLIPGQVSVQNLTPFVPTKLFEYMACGIPVVASALPSIQSFYGRGDWGELVAPHEPQSHAAAIARLLDDRSLAQAKGSRGRQLVEQYFNWDVEARKLLRLYSAVLGDVSTGAVPMPVDCSTRPHPSALSPGVAKAPVDQKRSIAEDRFAPVTADDPGAAPAVIPQAGEGE